jgi:hypothetical protein
MRDECVLCGLHPLRKSSGRIVAWIRPPSDLPEPHEHETFAGS